MKISLIPLSLCFLSFMVWSQTPPQNDFQISFEKTETKIPLTYRSGASPVVEVKINDKGPYRFMFDTGSPFVLKLDKKVFDEMKLTVIDSIMAGAPGGKPIAFPITKIDKLQLGDFTIIGSDAMVRNYNETAGMDRIDGVIGMSFFSEALVEFNFESDLLIIRKGKLDPKDPQVFQGRYRKDVPGMTLTIGDKKLDADFDTGNMGSLMIHAPLISSDIMANSPRVIGKAKSLTGEFEIKEVELKPSLKLGTVEFEKPVVTLNEVMPQTNVGIRLMRQMNITFDKSSNLIKLVKHSKQKSVQMPSADCSKYVGTYTNRVVTCENGQLYSQRMVTDAERAQNPNQQINTPKLKLVPAGKDEFSIEQFPNGKIKFVIDQTGNASQMHVLNPQGQWEVSKKTK